MHSMAIQELKLSDTAADYACLIGTRRLDCAMTFVNDGWGWQIIPCGKPLLGV
jgi:hypothetical protein